MHVCQERYRWNLEQENIFKYQDMVQLVCGVCARPALKIGVKMVM